MHKTIQSTGQHIQSQFRAPLPLLTENCQGRDATEQGKLKPALLRGLVQLSMGAEYRHVVAHETGKHDGGTESVFQHLENGGSWLGQELRQSERQARHQVQGEVHGQRSLQAVPIGLLARFQSCQAPGERREGLRWPASSWGVRPVSHALQLGLGHGPDLSNERVVALGDGVGAQSIGEHDLGRGKNEKQRVTMGHFWHLWMALAEAVEQHLHCPRHCIDRASVAEILLLHPQPRRGNQGGKEGPCSRRCAGGNLPKQALRTMPPARESTEQKTGAQRLCRHFLNQLIQRQSLGSQQLQSLQGHTHKQPHTSHQYEALD
mmetsp:Transcript_10410/g.22832  ORF Transcript_10410/g.22832 Transcript_10410/m.22832 type:complete len:319 (+) Transcript_10410:573-1529(+)